jgi:hypothetical protein
MCQTLFKAFGSISEQNKNLCLWGDYILAVINNGNPLMGSQEIDNYTCYLLKWMPGTQRGLHKCLVLFFFPICFATYSLHSNSTFLTQLKLLLKGCHFLLSTLSNSFKIFKKPHKFPNQSNFFPTSLEASLYSNLPTSCVEWHWLQSSLFQCTLFIKLDYNLHLKALHITLFC